MIKDQITVFQWEVLQRLPTVFVNGRTKVYFLQTWVVNLSCCSVLFIYFPLERLHGLQLCSDADFYLLNVKSLSYGFCLSILHHWGLYLFVVCDFMDSCLLIRAWKNTGFCETQLSFYFVSAIFQLDCELFAVSSLPASPLSDPDIRAPLYWPWFAKLEGL